MILEATVAAGLIACGAILRYRQVGRDAERRAIEAQWAFDRQERLNEWQREVTIRRGEPGYIDGEQAETRLGFEGVTDGAIETGSVTSARLSLPFANRDGEAIVGTDSHKAFPPKVRLSDADLCNIGGHLLPWNGRTCVRCGQVVEP